MGVLVDQSKVPADPTESRGILSQIQDGAEGLGDALGDGFNGFVSGIAGALSGVITGGPFAPVAEAGEAFRNGQLDLENRVDLLFGISGYGFSYMSKNINAQWSLNNSRRLPFDRQLGPAKNTHITEDGRLSLDGVGAWLVLVKTHGQGTTFGGNAMIRQTVRIRRPNGQFYHTCIDDASTFSEGGFITDPKGAGTLLSVFPVVIDEPGCKVEVETWTGAWRWWDGGTRFSMMAAIRNSTDTEHKGDEIVPNEKENEVPR